MRTVPPADMDVNTSHTNWNSDSFALTWQDVLPGVVFGVVIILINMLTLAAIVLFEKVKERCTVLIGSLCVCDALSGISLILSSLNVITRILNDRCLANVSGYLYYLAIYIPTTISHCHISGLSVDRLIAVVQPLKYHSRCKTPKKVSPNPHLQTKQQESSLC